MTFSHGLRFSLLSLVVATFLQSGFSSEASAKVNLCKTVSAQKMPDCQRKAKVDVKKVDKNLKKNTKPLITPVDILMFLL